MFEHDEKQLLEELKQIDMGGVRRLIDSLEYMPEDRLKLFIKLTGYENNPQLVKHRINELSKLYIIALKMKNLEG